MSSRYLDDKLDELRGGATNLIIANDEGSICDEGAEKLAKVIERNTTLIGLSLNGVHDVGDAGVEKLAKALERNTTLQRFALESCTISDAGVQKLAKALEGNTTLRESLQIKYCKLGDMGMESLANMLEHNTTLAGLELSCSQISDVGKEKLIKAVERNTTLQLFTTAGSFTQAQDDKLMSAGFWEHPQGGWLRGERKLGSSSYQEFIKAHG